MYIVDIGPRDDAGPTGSNPYARSNAIIDNRNLVWLIDVWGSVQRTKYSLLLLVS